MTPATLRKLEWASVGTEIRSTENITTVRSFMLTVYRCPVCKGEKPTHAPDCELDAAIREAEQAEQAEQAEKGERPEIQAGDVLVFTSGTALLVDSRDAVPSPDSPAYRHIRALYRDPLWRQEPPTHD